MPHRTQRYSKIGDTMKTIDLSGKWNYKTDIDDSQTIDSIKFENNNFNLPGSTCDNRIGKKTEYFDKYQKRLYVHRESDMNISLLFGCKKRSTFRMIQTVKLSDCLWSELIYHLNYG